MMSLNTPDAGHRTTRWYVSYPTKVATMISRAMDVVVVVVTRVARCRT
jgi:hypothetical protein